MNAKHLPTQPEDPRGDVRTRRSPPSLTRFPSGDHVAAPGDRCEARQAKPSAGLRLSAWMVILVAVAGCEEPFAPMEPQICAMAPEVRLALPCSNEPIRVADDPGFVALAAGMDHSCGLTAAGDTYCWGANHFGALGRAAGGQVFTRPMRIAGDQRFEGLTAGANHTCGWTADGAGYCWGSNAWAELGIGSDQSIAPSGPVPIAGDLRFTTLSAGARHTCGIERGGRTYCWGTDWFGQLGRGIWDMGVAPTPTAVVGGNSFVAIGTGQDASCALTSDGEAYCWGMGSSGELGTRATGICRDYIFTYRCSPTPLRVETGKSFVSLHTGTSHSCALTADGEAYCWGRHGHEPSGHGPADGFVPMPVPDRRFRDLSAGGSTCGITTGGEAVCWGFNYFGQLGTGSRKYHDGRPAPVAGGHLFRALAVGHRHACGITEEGATFCWGSNEWGQLGAGVW
jgi:alpha-tubulin suppressor-like RCC1 family protein